MPGKPPPGQIGWAHASGPLAFILFVVFAFLFAIVLMTSL